MLKSNTKYVCVSLVPDGVKLGVIRLDYHYPPIPGDVDCPESFNYDVVYKMVPGLTFEISQSGKYVFLIIYNSHF